MGTPRQNHQVNETDVIEKTSGLQQAQTRARMNFAKNDQADRAISTGKLHASPRFHIRPINVVVYHGSQRDLVLRLVSRLDAFSGYLFHT